MTAYSAAATAQHVSALSGHSAIGRDTVQYRQFMNEGVRPLEAEMLITVFLRGTAFGMLDGGIAMTVPSFCSLCFCPSSVSVLRIPRRVHLASMESFCLLDVHLDCIEC